MLLSSRAVPTPRSRAGRPGAVRVLASLPPAPRLLTEPDRGPGRVQGRGAAAGPQNRALTPLLRKEQDRHELIPLRIPGAEGQSPWAAGIARLLEGREERSTSTNSAHSPYFGVGSEVSGCFLRTQLAVATAGDFSSRDTGIGQRSPARW